MSFASFSFGRDDDNIGGNKKRFKAQGGNRYRVSFAWWKGVEDGKLNMNASEQITIQIIHELAGRGMSVRKIAARLNDLRRPCRGNAWHKTTVHRILSGSTLKPTQCELIKGQPHDT